MAAETAFPFARTVPFLCVTPNPASMLYPALIQTQWKNFARALRGKNVWISSLVLLPLVLYFVFVLIALGFYFDKFFDPLEHRLGSVGRVNAQAIPIFISTFIFRFFFQRPPRIQAQPYLHLPISRSRLVRYFQVASLASFHNLYPFVFLLPFWSVHVVGQVPPSKGDFFWLAGTALCLFLLHYLNTYVRVALDKRSKPFLIAAVIIVAAYIIDQVLDIHGINLISSAIFDALLFGNPWVLGALALLTIATYMVSSRALLQNLVQDSGPAQRQVRVIPSALDFGSNDVSNLIVFELKMMWRNKRPRQYVLVSILVSTVYSAILLSDYNTFYGSLMSAIIGLFASGVFALNYGQLMFAWESRYFDGFLSRDIKPRQMVLAKLAILQGSCLLLFLISLPLFVWLAQELITLHVAFLFYNAGVTSVLMLALGIRNRRRLDASKGHFLNYEGFSFLHWLWVIPTVIPPALLLFFLEYQPGVALALIAGIGLLSMLLSWPWSMMLARTLSHRKHLMAAGFRSYEH